MSSGEREAMDRLDAYLDAIALGRPTPLDRVDSDWQALDDSLRRLTRLPDPSPDFVSQLWSDLMQTMPSGSTPADLHSTPNGWVRSAAAIDPPAALGTPRIRPVAIAHLATAAVLLLSLALNVVAFGLLPLRGDDNAVRLPAPAIEGAADPVAFAWLTRGAADRIPLTDPYHLAIDPEGYLWIPDPWLNQIQVIAPDGTFREAWGAQGRGAGQFNLFNVGSPYLAGGGAVAFAPEATFYVLDPGNHRVQRFGPDRSFLGAWGSEGREDGQFLDLIDVAVDARGHVYVLDAGRHDVQVFAADGRFLAQWGGAGVEEGQFRTPSGIAVDADGNLVVADTGNQRLQTFSPEGKLLAAWSDTDADAYVPADVAVDAAGRVFVTDVSSNRVLILGDEGQVLAAWGGPGGAPGQFDGPTGLALDAAGGVYVAERGNNRVQAFRLLPPFGP